MFTQTLILTGLLLSAPPEAAPTVVNLEKGLETRWVGTFTEASFRPGVKAIRNYDVDVRILVLDKDDRGFDVALFARVFLKPELKSTQPPSGVVRIELGRVNKNGKIVVMPSAADFDNPDAKSSPWPLVQLQGLPTHEAGVFVELPDGELKVGSKWNRDEKDRPALAWNVTGQEIYKGQNCFRIIGEQKTNGYYSDRIRGAEWRREDRVTLVGERGIAAKLERIVERRDPDAEELSFRSVLTLEQQGKLTYSGRLFDERKEEAVHAAAFTAILDRHLADSGRAGPQPFEALVKRIRNFETDHVASDSVPYREAINAVRQRAASAAKGNLPPMVATDEPSKPASEPLTVGQPITDITAKGIGKQTDITLSKHKGKVLVLAYFQPSAPSAGSVLKLLQSVHMQGKKDVVAVPLVIGDTKAAEALHSEGKMTVSLYDGTTVYKTHGLDATPVFILVDAEGVVRQVFRGWGSETAEQVARALNKLQ